ncbi:hypothetical protein EVAR_14322_1 [Eumeta japonica]|uniref:Uncharacterized protein n=1 Tax=Eumeta variegata TaxID=151549 RepID=A0A4C1UM27_EUMVA|nr:hypothetical protein EVAR_14322_1 [Eumeta japonica]
MKTGAAVSLWIRSSRYSHEISFIFQVPPFREISLRSKETHALIAPVPRDGRYAKRQLAPHANSGGRRSRNRPGRRRPVDVETEIPQTKARVETFSTFSIHSKIPENPGESRGLANSARH